MPPFMAQWSKYAPLMGHAHIACARPPPHATMPAPCCCWHCDMPPALLLQKSASEPHRPSIVQVSLLVMACFMLANHSLLCATR
jgi:hypothetical protein